MQRTIRSNSNSNKMLHVNARSQHPMYPQRVVVTDENVMWHKQWKDYSPISYTSSQVFQNDRTKVTNGWADPPDFKSMQDEYDRSRSYEDVQLLSKDGLPLNPKGRTGMIGRGLLGKWGSNHAADPIVTRWSSDELQVALIIRSDTKEPAIPGGMVDAGECASATLRREFGEEAGGQLTCEQMDEIFHPSKGVLIYKGYVDDPRNTDNAWMETMVMHFHVSDALGEAMTLDGGSDAVHAEWIGVKDPCMKKLYASHTPFILMMLVQFEARETHNKRKAWLLDAIRMLVD